MGSIYRPSELQRAAIGICGVAAFVGIAAGWALQDAICTHTPARPWFVIVLVPVLAMLGDVAYRYFHRAAAERIGSRRFISPLSGGRVVIFPLWMVAFPVAAYAVFAAARAGVCG